MDILSSSDEEESKQKRKESKLISEYEKLRKSGVEFCNWLEKQRINWEHMPIMNVFWILSCSWRDSEVYLE